MFILIILLLLLFLLLEILVLFALVLPCEVIPPNIEARVDCVSCLLSLAVKLYVSSSVLLSKKLLYSEEPMLILKSKPSNYKKSNQYLKSFNRLLTSSAIRTNNDLFN